MLPESYHVRATLGFGFLCIIAWFAHFYLSQDFFLYEDDYTQVVDAMARNFQESVYNFYCHMRDWPQGRPLSFALKAPFSFIGVNIAGLWGVYIVGYLILMANTALLFILARRMMGAHAAIFAAMAFCLFPADTVKISPTHFMGNEPAVTFLLLAFLVYMGRFRILSYPLIFLATITYESALLPFLAAPLLQSENRSELKGAFIRHLVAMGALVIIYCMIRMSFEEARMTQQMVHMGAWQILYKSVTAMIMGPLVSLGSFVLPPVWKIRVFDANAWLIMITVMAASLASFTCFFRGNTYPSPPPVQALVASLVMLALAYPMAFFPPHWPPLSIATTDSRVHFAATVGGSLTIGILLAWMYGLITKMQRKALFLAVACMYFSLLAGYHYSVQVAYKQSGVEQRQFWSQVLELCPDLEENTIILAEKPLWDHKGLVSVHSWATRFILEKIIRFPEDWDEPPRLFLMDDWFKGRIFQENGKIEYRMGLFGDVYQPFEFEQENLIVLGKDSSGLMVRLTGAYPLGSDRHISMRLKPETGSTLEGFEPGVAYQYFFSNPYPP